MRPQSALEEKYIGKPADWLELTSLTFEATLRNSFTAALDRVHRQEFSIGNAVC